MSPPSPPRLRADIAASAALKATGARLVAARLKRAWLSGTRQPSGAEGSRGGGGSAQPARVTRPTRVGLTHFPGRARCPTAATSWRVRVTPVPSDDRDLEAGLFANAPVASMALGGVESARHGSGVSQPLRSQTAIDIVGEQRRARPGPLSNLVRGSRRVSRESVLGPTAALLRAVCLTCQNLLKESIPPDKGCTGRCEADRTNVQWSANRDRRAETEGTEDGTVPGRGF